MPHRIVGYLIGDDFADQQRAMVDAARQPGAGELVHPTLGSLFGSIVGGLTTTLRNGDGPYIELSFAFVENSGGPASPAASAEGASNASTDAAAGTASARQAKAEGVAVNGAAISAASASYTGVQLIAASPSYSGVQGIAYGQAASASYSGSWRTSPRPTALPQRRTWARNRRR